MGRSGFGSQKVGLPECQALERHGMLIARVSGWFWQPYVSGLITRLS